MTKEEAIEMLNYIKRIGNGESSYKNDAQSIALDMAISALSETKGEPTDEEVISYCNKRGYVICTQAVMDNLKREQCRIQFKGCVEVDGEAIKQDRK